MSSTNRSDTDVAIVGMACVFPGAADMAAFWANIISARDCITEHPDPAARAMLDPGAPRSDRIYNTRGGFLGDLARFDPGQHGIMPGSVDGGDPDHFLSLQVACAAMADAGYDERTFPNARSEAIVGHGSYLNAGIVNWVQHGVVLDQTVNIVKELTGGLSQAQEQDVRKRLKDSLPPLEAHTVPALIPSVIAGRIANRLDFGGDTYVIDAACSSALIAVDNAARDLATGKCDLAVAGASQVSLPPAALVLFCLVQALSRGEAVRAFAENADGTLLGEGVGMIVLKRRADAERDGDRIYALVRAVGVSSDGRGAGLLAPRADGQVLALERAYRAAAVDPATIGLVEAHGTGIPLGDATELQALNAVFGDKAGGGPPCALGSVKSMIGHCVPAAGMAGLIKAALSIYRGVLPPTLHCERPIAGLGGDGGRFRVNRHTRPWIQDPDVPRRAGVSSMGFGGINAHCVLQEHRGGAHGE